MALTISKTAIILTILASIISSSLSSPIIDELNQPPPPDFSSTLSANCLRDPSLRYCNSTTSDLLNIFKSTIVSKHLCIASQNPNCNLSFSFINLHSTPTLAPLYLSFSFFWKYCPTSILSINLSNNSLKGPFPSHVLQCMQIHALDLSHNALSGHAPLEAFKLLTNLSFLNLSYNHFSEITDEKDEYFLIKRFNSSSFIHSGLLLSHHHGFKVTTSIFLLVGVLVFAVSVVGFLGRLFVRRPDYLPSILRRRRHNKYTPAMLKAATGGFSDDNLVEKSERWEIYRGRLRDGTEVGIRVQRGRFSRVSRNAFVEECRVLAMMEHENLVKVLGWCDNRDLIAVVSDQRTSVCSVEEWLVGSSPPWNHRLKVCIGVMQGLRYLQQQWPQVGCDLRTSNVMLSQELNPLISKFRVGTKQNNAEAKIVYKFGLFLLEMITNKNPREDFGGGEEEFVGWINKVYNHGHSRTLIDEKLRVISSQAYEEMKRALSIGLACTAVKSDSLPTIDEIFLMFSRISASSQVVHKIHAERKKELSKSSHHGLHIL
ncbi:hypothetical protein J5N97_017765 [Dioscorea zingiberensis]|uniref:Protein kinase domain-containing protein n=1 Tax=Dioscorea zingiberensis TaxID=325984 RepID=A0A9D5CM78_9LILI|nr:hypothetical protein J5N97_017765 [Dioscorea zingiberensis]